MLSKKTKVSADSIELPEKPTSVQAVGDVNREVTASPVFQVIDHHVNSAGVVNVTALIEAGRTPTFAFADRHGTTYPVKPNALLRSSQQDVNLISTVEADDSWAIEHSGGKINFGKNLNEVWALDTADTYYIGSDLKYETGAVVATAIFKDPLSGEATPIRPGLRYQFSLLMGMHRCPAELRLDILSDKGEVLKSLERSVDRAFRGGVEAAGYDAVVIDFIAPDNAANLEIRVKKGRTDQKEDSYLFFARPILQQYDTLAKSPDRTRRLSATLLKLIRKANSAEILNAIAEPPGELFDNGKVRTSLTVSLAGAATVIPDLLIERLSGVEITTLRFENSEVTLAGKVPTYSRELVEAGVFIDGELSAKATFEVEDRNFRGVLALNHKHLDGKPHLLEVRLLPEQVTLAQNYELLPEQITPWEALQSYAKGPFDIKGSPAAPHHFRSFKAWMEAAENGRTLPPLSKLHEELLQGFTKRTTYPHLALPEVEDPDVSIVIPVHNKFEVTYFCLCSLLFAFTALSFEVIVVDDGSSDTTTDIESIVSGISLVRHPAAMGFVPACNDGAKLARGRYVAFLNNDTEVTARWLDELVSAFDSFDGVGLVGAKLLYPNGSLQEAGGIVWRSGNPWNVGRNGNAADPQFNYLRQVDYLSGAAILLPRDLWLEVGGFSPELTPAYFEDTDLAMKVRASGRAVVYVPTSTVFHFEGQSAGTSVASGMKRFQEVNRPKFRRKWASLYSSHGAEGERPDREKDRNVAFRVLFVDQRFPYVDADAGSYAAFQEIRLLQSLGAKVTFLPRNLAWMDRHTRALERIGVECLYAPFVMDFVQYIRDHAADYDVVFVCRYKIAQQIMDSVRNHAPATKLVLNLADLHFLRELREALAGSPGYSLETARLTREDELAMARSADLTLSYSDVELAVLQSHLAGTGRIAKLPWVVEPTAAPRRSFDKTKDLLFLGGFGHPPNIEAVKFFVREVLPRVRDALPGVRLNVVGSSAPAEILALTSDSVIVSGYVPDLDEVFEDARVFVAPLQAGAGMKGKVLEGMARGQTMVLSPIAAEGTGLVDQVDCLVAKTAEQWAAAVIRTYTDEALWTELGLNAKRAAATRFSFDVGAEMIRDAFAQIDLFGNGKMGLYYKYARPKIYAI